MKHIYEIRLFIALIILIAAITTTIGFYYPVSIFDLQFAAMLQRNLVNISIVSAAIIIIFIILTAIFGRIYCSTLCPLGILQETICILSGKKYKKSKNLPVKYIVAAVIFGGLFFGSTFLLKYIEPYTLFASAVNLSVTGLVIAGIIIIISLFKGRFFCTNICPVGAVLGLISQFSKYKLYIDKDICISCGNCERNCQAECIDSNEKSIDNETCIKCLKCINTCPKSAVKYGSEKSEKETKFSPERRKIIITGVLAIILGAAVKAGMSIKTAEKIKNTILPPGSGSPENFLNKCFNCNLCVEHCSEKIIKKADKEFAAPHIEYGDFGHCSFNCNKCGEICPTGAINRLSKEIKQKTRIAIASINKENCISCGVCRIKCPKNTIFEENGDFVINPENCIGCGICRSVCPGNAIEIFAVKEQKVI